MKRTIFLFATMAFMTISSLLAQDITVNKIIETGRSNNQVIHCSKESRDNERQLGK